MHGLINRTLQGFLVDMHGAPLWAEIASQAYPTPAKRLLNSRLDCSSFEKVFGLPRPDWKTGLAAVLRDLA